MLLPWEYGVRNLARRPVRTLLTFTALATVVMLVFVIVGFIRGLERSLAISGDRDVVLVYSVNSEENIENSSIAAATPALLSASLNGIWRRYGLQHISPELYIGSRVSVDPDVSGLGLVRGVTHQVSLVRRNVRLLRGTWPGLGQVMMGKLSAAKLGADPDSIEPGKSIEFEGRSWVVSGVFSAGGAAVESEIWCNLADLQTSAKRQDLSLVALLMAPGASAAEVSLLCKERTDLELRAMREADYYATLQQHYGPVLKLAWLVVLAVSGAGVFAGLNMMYGAVAGRIREIATLQAIGYQRWAILLSLIQEGAVLAAAASLISGLLALTMVNGMAVRFTMGAFSLRIDSAAILIGSSVGLFLGVLGALPPAFKALGKPVAESLKAV